MSRAWGEWTAGAGQDRAAWSRGGAGFILRMQGRPDGF